MMISKAVTAGHTAKYVLFDSWFATPKGMIVYANLAIIRNRIFFGFRVMAFNAMKLFMFNDCRRANGILEMTIRKRNKEIEIICYNVELQGWLRIYSVESSPG